MALSNTIHGSVATPRIWIDYIQYASAMGYKSKTIRTHAAGDSSLAFDGNPVNMFNYVVDSAGEEQGKIVLKIFFKNYGEFDGEDAWIEGSDSVDHQFSTLLKSINYYGLLGHRLAIDNAGGRIELNGLISPINSDNGEMDYTSIADHEHSGIVGDPNSLTDLGFSLYSIDDGFTKDGIGGLLFAIMNNEEGPANFTQGDIVRLGSCVAGRYWDFPHNTNLQQNINYEWSGVNRQKTVGGSDITNITYTKPMWGNIPAWKNIETSEYNNPQDYIKTENYKTVANASRRSWDLTFSYLSKEDTFPKTHHGSVGGEYFAEYGISDYASLNSKPNENLVSNFLSLTMGGQIPFYFQPDKTKNDFCTCKLKSNGVSIQQSAPNLYTCKLSFVEVW